jgi:hypothetical protein
MECHPYEAVQTKVQTRPQTNKQTGCASTSLFGVSLHLALVCCRLRRSRCARSRTRATPTRSCAGAALGRARCCRRSATRPRSHPPALLHARACSHPPAPAPTRPRSLPPAYARSHPRCWNAPPYDAEGVLQRLRVVCCMLRVQSAEALVAVARPSTEEHAPQPTELPHCRQLQSWYAYSGAPLLAAAAGGSSGLRWI